MKLITKQTETKSRIDQLVNLEYSVGSNNITCYFKTFTKIGDEEFGETFDQMNPVTIPILEVKEALDIIANKALTKRSQQLQISETPVLSLEPDYKGFYNALLISQIFGVVQGLTTTNTTMSLAYTTFGLALAVSIAGHINNDGLQASVNGVLAVLKGLVPDSFTLLAQELKEIVELYNIPVIIGD